MKRGDSPSPEQAIMARDDIRVERIRQALEQAELEALVCTLPVNVLLLTGYWPVAGTAVAVATREGRLVLIAPKDEMETAVHSLADEVRQYQPRSLEEMTTPMDAVWLPLREAAHDLRIEQGLIGFERGPALVSGSNPTLHLYGASIIEMLGRSLPDARPVPADAVLAQLRALPTPLELTRIRAACRLAERAFTAGAQGLRLGMQEHEVASLFRAPLNAPPAAVAGQPVVHRAGGQVGCASGPNSALALYPDLRSRERQLERGDLVLVQCQAYADGYWGTATRTFTMGEAGERKLKMYGAVAAALRAALDAVRPGVRAAEVDRAAREVIAAHGFGGQFNHAAGHGVGFAPADESTVPCLHPAADDVLAAGMVFSLAPGIRVEGFGGLRHGEMVLVTEAGAELLTPFQASIEQLVIGLPADAEPAVRLATIV